MDKRVGLLKAGEVRVATSNRIPSAEIVDQLYEVALGLQRCGFQTPTSDLPENGVYLFFEAGETVKWRDQIVERIVRVGTHKADRRFRPRIRQHYGRRHSLRGDKNGSVFRKHLGAALMRRVNPEDPRLPGWLGMKGGSYMEVEEWVSRELRERFTFVCVPAARKEDRLLLEEGLIALLALYRLGEPSEGWLGRYATDARMIDSGLWNVQKLGGAPLSASQLGWIRAATCGGNEDRMFGTVESSGARAELGGSRLVIIPCGHAKIWDREPERGPTPAREAYTGPPFLVNRQYAEHSGERWLILSAKYGFVEPDALIPGPYDVSLRRGALAAPGSEPVNVAELRRQVEQMEMHQYRTIVGLGGVGYREAIRQAFAPWDVELIFPFAGLRIGEAMRAVKAATAPRVEMPEHRATSTTRQEQTFRRRPEDGEMKSSLRTKTIWGNKPYHERARRAMPILVRQALAGQTISYSDLAQELGMPNPRNLNYPLAAISSEIVELNRRQGWETPAIAALVVHMHDGLPGEGFGLEDPRLARYRELSPSQRRRMIAAALADIFAYGRWADVLEALNLPQPLSAEQAYEIGAEDTAVSEPAPEAMWAVETRQLKELIAANPALVDVRLGRAIGQVDFVLPSLDVLDVIVQSKDEWVAVVVREQGASLEELRRSVFDCVKYRALIEAMIAAANGREGARAVLALGGNLPPGLAALKNTLGIQVIEMVGGTDSLST